MGECMKLTFKKADDLQISVFQKVGKQEEEFSYINMIKSLINSKVMEPPEIIGTFTEAEIKSINSMITCINGEISTQKTQSLA